MKKTKLLMPITGVLAIGAGIAPILTTTSCNKNSDVEVKQNDNITVTANAVTKGQAYEIGFTLTTGYALDIVESTIKFGEDEPVYLIQCDVQTTNGNKIVVPAEYVSDTKVVIDIKAESNDVLNITQQQYAAAWNSIIQPTTTRRISISGVNISAQYDESGQMIEYSNGTTTSKMYGATTHSVQTLYSDTTGTQMKIGEYWSEADDYVGFWNYEEDIKTGRIYRYSMTQGNADNMVLALRLRFKNNVTELTKDTLLNVYSCIYKIGDETRNMYLKFDSNHRISYIAYTVEAKVGKKYYDNFTIYNVEHSASSITIPTITVPDLTYLHNTFDESTHVCETGTTMLGRYEFTVPSTFDKTKTLVFTFDKALTNIDKTVIEVYSNDAVLTKDTDYTIDTTAGTITIKADKFDASADVYMTIGTPTTVDSTGITKVTVTNV